MVNRLMIFCISHLNFAAHHQLILSSFIVSLFLLVLVFSWTPKKKTPIRLRLAIWVGVIILTLPSIFAANVVLFLYVRHECSSSINIQSTTNPITVAQAIETKHSSNNIIHCYYDDSHMLLQDCLKANLPLFRTNQEAIDYLKKSE
jgi:hypothetical protein